jgi:transcription elongation factor GreA
MKQDYRARLYSLVCFLWSLRPFYKKGGRFFFASVQKKKEEKFNTCVMAEVAYFTKEGLEKLKQELQELKTTGRAKISNAIAEARDKGDLSENAEYDAAKEAQGLHEAKIAQLQETLASARLLDESKLDTSKILALSIVKIKNVKSGATMTYQLVAESEADMKNGKISVSSPIAKGLLGKQAGEIAEITVPAGKMEFEILEVSR